MNFLKIAEVAGKLKKIKRTGWIKRNIPSPESVADHSFRVALLSYLFAKKLKLDITKAVTMALFHDLAESELGDIVIRDEKGPLPNYLEKIKRERVWFSHLSKVLDNDEIEILYQEYQENKTSIAQLVNQVDKLEMALQAYEYEKDYKINLQPFFQTSKSLITHEEIKKILHEIEQLRGFSG